MLGVDIDESSGQLIINTFDTNNSGGLDLNEQDAMWYYLLGYTTIWAILAYEASELASAYPL